MKSNIIANNAANINSRIAWSPELVKSKPILTKINSVSQKCLTVIVVGLNSQKIVYVPHSAMYIFTSVVNSEQKVLVVYELI